MKPKKLVLLLSVLVAAAAILCGCLAEDCEEATETATESALAATVQ